MGVVEVSDEAEWKSEVLESDRPVFVDFWAEWCGPCRMVGPVVEELAGDYEGRVKFVKVNVDKASAVAQKYSVYSIPTLAVFKGGEVAEQRVGASSKESYREMIDKAIA